MPLLQTQSKAGNLQHAWTDKMTESVISGAGRSFGWQLKIGNFKILTYAKPVPKAKLWNSFGRKGALVLSKSIASLSLPKVFSPLFQELVAIVFVLVLWWDVWWCKQVASSLFGLNSTVNEVGPTSMNNSQTSPVRAKPKGSKKEAPLPRAGAVVASATAAVAPAATKGIYPKY